MSASYRMHDEVSFRDFSHHFNGLGERCVVHSLMLHGIQVEAHSNPAVVHHGDKIGDEFLCFEVKFACRHGLFVVCPVRV